MSIFFLSRTLRRFPIPSSDRSCAFVRWGIDGPFPHSLDSTAHSGDRSSVQYFKPPRFILWGAAYERRSSDDVWFFEKSRVEAVSGTSAPANHFQRNRRPAHRGRRPADPDPSDRREAVRICVGTRAKIRVGSPDAPLVTGMVRDLSCKSVGLLMEFPPRLNELCWIYIPKRIDPTDHIAMAATISRCARGGLDKSIFHVAAMFVEGEAPALPKPQEPEPAKAPVIARHQLQVVPLRPTTPVDRARPKINERCAAPFPSPRYAGERPGDGQFVICHSNFVIPPKPLPSTPRPNSVKIPLRNAAGGTSLQSRRMDSHLF